MRSLIIAVLLGCMLSLGVLEAFCGPEGKLPGAYYIFPSGDGTPTPTPTETPTVDPLWTATPTPDPPWTATPTPYADCNSIEEFITDYSGQSDPVVGILLPGIHQLSSTPAKRTLGPKMSLRGLDRTSSIIRTTEPLTGTGNDFLFCMRESTALSNLTIEVNHDLGSLILIQPMQTPSADEVDAILDKLVIRYDDGVEWEGYERRAVLIDKPATGSSEDYDVLVRDCEYEGPVPFLEDIAGSYTGTIDKTFEVDVTVEYSDLCTKLTGTRPTPPGVRKPVAAVVRKAQEGELTVRHSTLRLDGEGWSGNNDHQLTDHQHLHALYVNSAEFEGPRTIRARVEHSTLALASYEYKYVPDDNDSDGLADYEEYRSAAMVAQTWGEYQDVLDGQHTDIGNIELGDNQRACLILDNVVLERNVADEPQGGILSEGTKGSVYHLIVSDEYPNPGTYIPSPTPTPIITSTPTPTGNPTPDLLTILDLKDKDQSGSRTEAIVRATRLPSWWECGLGRGIIRVDRDFTVDPHGGGDFDDVVEALEYVRDLPDPSMRGWPPDTEGMGPGKWFCRGYTIRLLPGEHQIKKPLLMGPLRDMDDFFHFPTDPDLLGSYGPSVLSLYGMSRPACVVKPDIENWDWETGEDPHFLMVLEASNKFVGSHLTFDLTDFYDPTSGTATTVGGMARVKETVIEDFPPRDESVDCVLTDFETWGPAPGELGGSAEVEAIVDVEHAMSSLGQAWSQIRVPCAEQPWIDCRYASILCRDDLADCGEALGKGLEASNPYATTAVKITGGGEFGSFLLPPGVITRDGATVGAAGTVLAGSAGPDGSRGVAILSGGSLIGAFTTNLRAIDCAIAGFETDLARDTAPSWEKQEIHDVYDGQGLNLPGGSKLVIGSGGSLKVYGYNSWNPGDSEEINMLAKLEMNGVFTDGGSGTYANTLLYLQGPIRHGHTQVHGGAAPAVPVYLKFKATSSKESYDVLYVSLPPGINLATTDDELLFLVGSHGETFLMPEINESIDDILPSGDSLAELEDLLASEWAEMWVHATAFRTMAGNISVDSIYPLGN